MDSFRVTLPQGHSTSPVLQFPIRTKARRREPPTALGVRALHLHYHFAYSDLGASASLEELGDDTTLVIDALYEYHQNRQAMLGALAQMRGDDSSEQVW